LIAAFKEKKKVFPDAGKKTTNWTFKHCEGGRTDLLNKKKKDF